VRLAKQDDESVGKVANQLVKNPGRHSAAHVLSTDHHKTLLFASDKIPTQSKMQATPEYKVTQYDAKTKKKYKIRTQLRKPPE